MKVAIALSQGKLQDLGMAFVQQAIIVQLDQKLIDQQLIGAQPVLHVVLDHQNQQFVQLDHTKIKSVKKFASLALQDITASLTQQTSH
jgi:hypothetical protein